MTAMLQSYHVAGFNALPSLQEACDLFDHKSGTSFVEKIFRDLLIKHNLESKLGIGLTHRHFDLEVGEKLVEVNNVAIPWAQDDERVNDLGFKTLPRAWAIEKEGRLMPYEFIFLRIATDEGEPLDFETNANLRAFAEDFIKAAQSTGLQDVVGLCLFPGPGFTGYREITMGRANILLSPDEVIQSTEDPSADPEVMWFFDQEYMRSNKKCKCQTIIGPGYAHKVHKKK